MNIIIIVKDHFCPFAYSVGRRFSGNHFAVTAVIPAVASGVLTYFRPIIQERYQVVFLTVFGILAAVMVAMLPMVQTIVGASVADRKYTEAERPKWTHQTLRLEVSRNLYSTIAWTVLLLVFSTIPLICLQIQWLPSFVKTLIAFCIYYVGASVAVGFLQGISGMYQVLDAQAKWINQSLKDHAPTSRNSKDQVA